MHINVVVVKPKLQQELNLSLVPTSNLPQYSDGPTNLIVFFLIASSNHFMLYYLTLSCLLNVI